MNHTELKDFYSQRLNLYSEKYETYRKKERNTNILRGYGEGKGTLLQFSCLENPMDRGAW